MKKIGVILLIGLFFMTTMRDMAIYVSFKINQEYITKNICINYDVPQVMCSGKCYLSEQLKEEKQKDDLPIQSAEDYKELIVYMDIINSSETGLDDKMKLRNYFRDDFYQKLYHSSVLKPPQV